MSKVYSNTHVYKDVSTGETKSVDLETGEMVILGDSMTESGNFRYSWQMGMLICNYVREGKSIAAIGRLNDMPAAALIYRWSAIRQDFREALDAAKTDRAEYYHDKVLEITEGITEKDDVPVAKVKIDTYKWAAEKGNPAKFGAKASNKIDAGAVTIIVNTGIQREEVIEVEVEHKEIDESSTASGNGVHTSDTPSNITQDASKV